LVVVDYAQLLTIADPDARYASHEVLARAASTLTKTASEEGLALIIASQTTKVSRTEADKGNPEAADTDASGADFARMPDVALSIMREQKKRGESESAETRLNRLRRRHLQFTKDRGTWQHPEDRRVVYYMNRAVVDKETYDGDDDFA